jgi:hypothetical protein
LSEQPFSDAAAAEDDGLPPPVPMSDLEEAIEPRRRPGWIAPAWFFFGILVGIIGFAAYNALVVKVPAAVPAQTESFDSNAMRAAARDGVLEAIATLQAGGPQPAAQQPQGPEVVEQNAFTVRAANQLGDPAAKVAVYEFSDFQ